MSKTDVFNYEWIDLVFEGRNQQYGAYQLRRQDSRTTLIALFSGIGIMALLAGIPVLVNHFKPQEIIAKDTTGSIVITPAEPFVLPKEKAPVTMPKKPAAAAPKSHAPTIKFNNPVAVNTPVTTVIPTQQQVQTTTIASQTNEGDGSGGIDIGPTSPTGTPEGTGTSPIFTQGSGNGPALLANLDEAPNFPGGLKEFSRLVGSKFRSPSVENATSIRVFVSFVVEKDGSMTDIKVMRDPGYGMAQEAIRVLKSIKIKWTPGKIKGQAVRTAYSLPIVVNVN